MSQPEVEINEDLYDLYVLDCRANGVAPTISDYIQWRYEENADLKMDEELYYDNQD